MFKVKLLCLLAPLLVGGLAQAELFAGKSGEPQDPVHKELVKQLDIKAEHAPAPLSEILNRLNAVIIGNVPCDLEAQSNLILVCNDFDQDPESAPIHHSVEQLYGVRKAICETLANRTQVPTECHNFFPGQSSGMSKKSLIRSELELASSADLELCIKELQKYNPFWISYSNNVRDADQISKTLRSQIELRHVIQVYRDFVSEFGSFDDLLHSVHEQQEVWFNEAFHKYQSFHNLQDETFSGFQNDFHNISANVFGDLGLMGSTVSARKAQIDQLSEQALTALKVFDTEAVSINEGLAKMKHGITELYSEAASQSASLTRQQADRINDLISSVVSEFKSLDTVFDNVNKQLNEWSQMSDNVLQLQNKQLANARQQLSMSDLTLEQQYKHLELVNLTHESLQELYDKTQQIKDRYEVYVAVATFLHDNAYLIVTVIAYATLAVFLAPFERTVVGRSASSIIKAIFCISQVSILALEYVQNKIGAIQLADDTFTAAILLLLALILTGSILIVFYSLCFKRSALKTDVEEIQPIMSEKTHVPSRMSDKQRRRLADISRSVRGGSTPPGL